jgi:hypothetical protein
MKSQKIHRASFSLEGAYRNLLANIARKTRRSMTDEMRIMIDQRAVQVGLEPVGEVDPNSLASSLAEMRSLMVAIN